MSEPRPNPKGTTGPGLRRRLARAALACLGTLALVGTACARPGSAPAVSTRPQPPSAAEAPAAPHEIRMDRSFQVLRLEGRSASKAEADRRRLALAAREIGDWSDVYLAGQRIDAARLDRLAATPKEAPLVRAAREDLRRAVDLDGFLLWLDDVLVAGRGGLRGETVWVSPGRGRKAGVLVHPDAIFEGRPRRYGETRDWLDVSPPKPQASYPPARDGNPLGPEWTMRYRNPSTESEMLAALHRERPKSGFAERIEHLIAELRSAGAEVQLNSTVRHRERGYLMWGAFVLSQADRDDEVAALCDRLDARNRAWGLDVPIRWRHPLGAEATRAAAREMSATYDVVYATEAGARESKHYGGRAADLTAVGLPRRLTLESPRGARRSFDLSDPDQTRDLSLTPELIDWIEVEWGLEKLRADYPHWNDARAAG